MGPCMYCGVMIYHEAIADRGYHRACHEKALSKLDPQRPVYSESAQALKDEKHRLRRARSKARKCEAK